MEVLSAEFITTLPSEFTRKTLVVADPLALVEDAISKSACWLPYAPCSVSFAYAVEVPIASALLVLSKKKRVLSPAKAVPFANWIAPVPPIAAEAPEVRHVPPIEKQPLLVRLIPFANVEVAVPVTANDVVVAFVLVLLIAVTFWSVVEPFTTIFCAVSEPTVPDCANRLVLEALVAKVLVLVLLVMVALVPRILVKSAEVAERTDAKKEVEVEFVLVLFNSVRFAKVVEAVKMFCPENVLLLARRVDDAPVPEMIQIPPTEKHPAWRLIPLANALEAVVLVSLSIAGGGDTVAALANAGVKDDFTYVSTAGGAFLEWLEGRELPGIAALAR